MSEPQSNRQKLLEQLMERRGIAPNHAGGRAISVIDRSVWPARDDQSRLAFPASFAQELIWVNATIDPSSSFYNVPLALAIRGPLERVDLAETLTRFVASHEVFRTTYHHAKGQLLQTIEPPPAFALEIARAETDAQLEEIALASVTAPFDLELGPVLRATLVDLAPEPAASFGEHVLILTIHHIATDGASGPLVAAELLRIYEEVRRGAAARPPAYPQYADFAVAQRRRLEAGAIAEDLKFWQEKLANAPRSIDLPMRGTRSSGSVAAEHQSAVVAPALWGALAAIARRESTSPFALVLTALAVVLRRMSGQDDLVIGTVHAARFLLDSETMLGNFINFVPLRIDLDASMTLGDAFARVRTVAQESLARAECPFERIVAAVGQSQNRRGLYNVAFLDQTQLDASAPLRGKLADLEIRPVQLGQQRSAAVDLRFVLELRDGGHVLICESPARLFAEEAIARLLDYVVTTLHALVGRPATPIAAIAFLRPSEQARIESWSHARRERTEDGTLFGRFSAVADQRAQAIAASCNGTSISYRDLAARAERIAAALEERGVRPGDFVGLFIDRSLEMLSGILGVLAAGAAYVPLDPTYPDERRAFMIEDSGVRLVLTDRAFAAQLGKVGAELVLLDEITGDVDAKLPLVDRSTWPSSLPAYVIYTSGSTGSPKGVVISQANVLRLIASAETHFTLRDDDVWSLFHSFAFDVSVFEMWGAFLSGARVVVVPRSVVQLPDELRELLRRERVTIFSQTPSAFRQLARVEAEGSRLEALRYVVFAGEALEFGTLRPWFERYRDDAPRLVNMYGITETTVHSTFHWVRASDLASAVGVMLDDLSGWVLDDRMQLTPIGVPGELHVGGGGLAHGYHRRPELTAERFVPDPFGRAGSRLYRSGDLLRHRKDGVLEYFGRIDHQVKVRGFRIELGEIETQLMELDAIRDAVVVARGERLVAYVVWSGERRLSRDEVHAFLAPRLPEYMFPSVVVALDALPLTPSGKIARNALPALDGKRDVARPVVAPVTAREHFLAELWSATLGVERVGLHDSFFELGGHSLNAIQTVATIRQTFGVDLPLRTIFDRPTIAGLDEAIARARGIERTDAATIPHLVPDPAHAFEPFPLTDVQTAYWVGRRADVAGGGISCHAYVEVDAPGVDLERLARAWRKLIDRHPMLRAIVEPSGEQRILPSVPPYVIEVSDARGLTASEQLAVAERVRSELSHRVHEAHVWPLFTIRATRTDVLDLRLHVSVDLIITDAGSIGILGRELVALYTDEATELEPVGLGFRDYVLAAKAFEASAAYRASEAYWRSRVAAFPGPPELPMRYATPRTVPPRFERRTHALPAAVWDRLQSRARARGFTPSATLLAAYGEVLGTWSSSKHFALTLTLFNRLPFHPEVDRVVGDFTSLTLLEVDLRDGVPFEAQARQMQSTLVDDLDHRHYSAVRVLRDLTRLRGAAAAAIPVVFTSTLGLGGARAKEPPSELVLETSFAITQTPQVWIDHQVFESDGELLFHWDAVEELFFAGVLDEMFAAYVALLERLADDEQAWSRPGLARPNASALAPHAFANATAAPISSALLHHGFERAAAMTPDALAVVQGERRLTYAETLLRATTVADWLEGRDVKKGELVALVMDKGWEQVVGALGILRAGAAYLPIDAALPEARIQLLLAHGEVRFALTQSTVDERTSWPVAVTRLVVDREAPAKAARPGGGSSGAPTDLAYVIYTSGSTGVPKGVMIDHRGAVNTIVDINERFAIGPDDRVLGVSSMSFDLSVYDVFGVLAAGGTLVLPAADRATDPLHWADLVLREKVTVWNSVPSLFELAVDGEALGPLRLAMLSGDWIPLDLPARARARVPRASIVSLGGATEASIWSILFPITDVDASWRSIPYGKPMRNQTFHVLDASLAPCPTWVTGELYIGGIGLAQGYWRDAEKTNASFVARGSERLYRTGDLGRYLPDGNIEFLGRRDLQVKVQGHRIELGEIEAALESHPSLLRATVVVVGERFDSKRLVGFVVPAPGVAVEDGSLEELRAFLGTKLPSYMVPVTFSALDAIPLGPNGKVDRRALVALGTEALEAQRAGAYNDASPAAETEVELALAAVWSETLHIAADSIRLGSTLFDLGGDSLRAVQLRARIQKRFRVEISLADIMGGDFESLAAAIEDALLDELA